MNRINRKQRKEDLVRRLYEEGKTRREIAQIARISLRDIGPILDEAGLDFSYSISSRAYRLFRDGMTPLEVALALNIREPEATKLHLEYERLVMQGEVLWLCSKNGDELKSIIELCKQIQASNMNVQSALNLLNSVGNDLKLLERRHKTLRSLIDDLENKRRYLESNYNDQCNRIFSLSETSYNYRISIQSEEEQLQWLYREKDRLETAIKHFKGNMKNYLRIRKCVENKLSEKRTIVRYALLALAELIRSDPSKYVPTLFHDNISQSSVLINIINNYNSYICPQNSRPSINYTNNEYVDMLVEGSEKLLNILIEELMEEIVVDYSLSTSSLPPTLPPSTSFPLLPPNHGQAEA